MFDNLADKINAAFTIFRGKGTVRQSDIDEALESIKSALIDGDVALEVIEKFIDDIRLKAYSITKSKSLNPGQQVVKLVNAELIKVLGGDIARALNFSKNPPTVILLAGLQGSGKTTFAGKLAKYLKKDGHTPVLVAADLQRPNAVQQLQTIGQAVQVEVFAPDVGVTSDGQNVEKKSLLSRIGVGKKGSNPVEVAKKGVEFAREKYYDVVIIDTAGRLAVDEELMHQVGDISQVISADEILFVIDSMLGQDAVLSAKAFSKILDLTGVVLTKIDGDARGGAALSVANVTNKPILFVSNGEKLDDIEVFHPDRIAGRILNMGDILSLIEKAENTMSEDQADKLAKKIIGGQGFDFNDFLIQMEQLKKMGSIKQLASLIPGFSQHKQALNQIDDSQITVFTSIVQSMTPFERANPKQINGARRIRIAKGSGRSNREINNLLDRFKAMSKMMKNMAGGKPMSDADFPNQAITPDNLSDQLALQQAQQSGQPMPFGSQMLGGKVKKKSKNHKKKKFGNPAKQAAWEQQHK